MNACSVDIKDMLVAESALGLVFSENLFIARMPDKPNECVVLFDSPGRTPALTMDKENYYYPAIQIKVRAESYEGGYSLIQNIGDVLQGRANETWNTTFYSLIYISSGPAMLEWDKNNRIIFVLNLEIQRRED